MKHSRNIFISFLVALVFPLALNAENVTIKAKLDSAMLLMGKQTLLHVEIAQDKGKVGYFVNEAADTLSAAVEIARWIDADTTDIGNGRIQINRDLLIQSFDSGMYVIPSLKYVVGKDTFLSNKLSLKVIPVKVDTLQTVHDYKPVEDLPFKLFDVLPDFITDFWWVYVVIVVLIALGAFVYFKWLRKGEIPLMPKKKIIPPFEEAIQLLEELRLQQLWQNGQEKEYFTRLTDILRNYIDRRFGINAVEMTSSQIISVLRKNEETKAVNEQLNQILEVADFVKFANMRTLPDDNETAFQRALNFVNETKPVELPAEEENNEGKDNNQGNSNDAKTKKEDKK